ncbi:unnamed protein product [Rotaria sp. Silwood2]|nr:unnamed protein product [Rotaria sp. Silwood2]CAF4616783.1 unnamed protein product [Rotaria sp. Silwood2]
MIVDSSVIVPILNRLCNFQWCWNSSTDSWINETEWINYNDIENEIIEDAYHQKKFDVEIDGDFVINLEFLLQYKKDNEFTVRPIRRIQLDSNRRNDQLRKDRFFMPIATESSLASEQIDDTTGNRIFRLLLSMGDLPRAYLFLNPPKNCKTIANVVEDAAKGIIKEGTSIGKAHEANWIAKQLLAVKDSGNNFMLCSQTGNVPAIIGKTCVALYTMESYFYKQLNYVTRYLCRITMQQVTSYGPFCYLIQSFLQEIKSVPEVTVYRGVDLSDE